MDSSLQSTAGTQKIKVFLAEDHGVVREGVRELIRREADMEVVGEAGDGEEAVRLIKECQPDVVLMDIAMPKLNGIEATRQVKALLPHTCILVLSAYDNPEVIFAIIEAGAAGYLLKNARGTELVNAIRSTHEGESVLHPAIAQRIFTAIDGTHEPRILPPDMPPEQRFAQAPPPSRRPQPHQDADEPLSERELEVLRLGADGLANKQIAATLHLSDRTIQTHWRNIFNKLGVSSRTEAVIYCLRRNWLVLGDDGEMDGHAGLGDIDT